MGRGARNEPSTAHSESVRPGGQRKKRSGPSRWTDEAITAALSEFLAGREQWPSRSQFKASGHGALHSALCHRGIDGWRSKFGYREVQKGNYPTFTDAQIEAALVEAITRLGRWPGLEDCTDGELHEVYSYLSRSARLERWATRLGFPGAVRKPELTPDAAIRQAREVIAEFGFLPGEVGLRRRGYGQLAVQVKRAGGATSFRSRHGI